MEFDTVSIVDKPVQYRIGNGSVFEYTMPTGYGKLRRDQDGAFSTTVIGEFKQVAAVDGVQGRQAKIIQNEQVWLFEKGETF